MPRSLIIDFGNLNFENTSSIRSLPSFSVAIVVLYRINLTILEYQSTTTSNVLYTTPLRVDGGSPITKSKDRSVHGPLGSGISISIP